MQNAGPLCSRESWTRQSRGCSAASTASDSKNSFKCQEKPWGNIRTSDGFYGLQTSSSSKIEDFDQEQDQVLHGNLQENVAPASLAWPEAYSSIGGDGFSQGFSVKAVESDGSDAEMARLLNTRNADVFPQEFNFQAPGSLCGHLQSASVGSLHSGYGLKMEEISRSNGVSVQTALATSPLQRLNFISFSANATDVVKDSAAGDDLSQSFLGRTNKCEDTAAADHKRTSSALEDGEQGGPSKRNRTSEAPSKFKVQVRKEKLGERITALQQLVSPFGKTDTASVLLEAIGYIKFLQDQVQVLSTPYIKGFPSSQAQDGRRGDSAVSNLRGRGLCLVPISSMQLMANDNGADYWASGIGGGARL